MIDIANLKMTYSVGEGTITVVDIPGWHVAVGDQVAIYGTSGSGKSTLLHILAGVLRPTSGSVRVANQRIDGLTEAAGDRFRARYVGYVFQNFNLLHSYSALENVLMGMTFSPVKPSRERATELLRTVGLGARLNHKPSQMSFGEQQRVAIARTVAKSPELILADEPTGSLDPRNTADVIDLLRATAAEIGATLVLVTHEPVVIDRFENSLLFTDLNCAWASVESEETRNRS